MIPGNKRFLNKIKCFDCGTITERILKFNPKFQEHKCPECGSENCEISTDRIKDFILCPYCEGKSNSTERKEWYDSKRGVAYKEIGSIKCDHCKGTGRISNFHFKVNEKAIEKIKEEKVRQEEMRNYKNPMDDYLPF